MPPVLGTQANARRAWQSSRGDGMGRSQVGQRWAKQPNGYSGRDNDQSVGQARLMFPVRLPSLASRIMDEEGSLNNSLSGSTRRSLSWMSARKTASRSVSTLALGDEVVVWQWEHKTGFRNYSDWESRRIEEAYMNGFDCFRLKAGKKGSTPMEIFFVDMIQHDPITGNTRRVRRFGKEGFFRWLRRWQLRTRRLILHGHWKRRDFQHYNRMRRKMIEGLERSESSFATYVDDHTWAARIVRSSLFQVISMTMVFLNTIWIALEADMEDRSKVGLKSVPWIVDCFFCLFFLIELSIRFAAFSRKTACLQDWWFCFDASLVLLMVCETWVLILVLLLLGQKDENGATSGSGLSVVRIIKLVRLLRLGRIAALVRLVPEAVTLLKGTLRASKFVFMTMLLLICLLFLFGVVFRMQVGDNAELDELIPSVLEGMLMLLVHGTLLDNPSKTAEDLGKHSAFLVCAFLVFIFTSSFTVLNMLIGVLCQVIATVTETEKEQAAVSYLRGTMLDLLDCYDQNGDRMMSEEEFEILMRNPEVHVILNGFGVDVYDLLALKKHLFSDRIHKLLQTNAGQESTEDADNGSGFATEEVLIYDLQVTVKCATGLRAKEDQGSSDPYCVVCVAGRGDVTFRTNVIRNSLHPIWDFSGVLASFYDGEAVQLTVYDRDWGRRDDFVGRASLLSRHFFPNGYEGDLTLIAPMKQLGDARTRGKIWVKITPLLETQRRAHGVITSPKLSFTQILEVLLRLRRSKTATVLDVTELRHVLVAGFNKLNALLGMPRSKQPPSHSMDGALFGDGQVGAQPSAPSGGTGGNWRSVQQELRKEETEDSTHVVGSTFTSRLREILRNQEGLRQQMREMATTEAFRNERLRQEVVQLQSQILKVEEALVSSKGVPAPSTAKTSSPSSSLSSPELQLQSCGDEDEDRDFPPFNSILPRT